MEEVQRTQRAHDERRLGFMMQKIRGARKSVVIWFNSSLLAALPVFEALHDALPELQQFLPDNIYKWAGLVVVVVNIILRFKTDKPLEEK